MLDLSVVDIEDQIKSVTNRFFRVLPSRLGAICELWTSLSQAGWDRDEAQVLLEKVHELAGSGSTFWRRRTT